MLDSIPTANRNTPARALLIPGTTVTPFVLGQYSMSVHGSNTVGHGHRHRRPARQQLVRQRPVQRLLHERRQRAGSDLHDRRRVGGDADRRPAHQQHPERRRQHLLRHASWPTARAASSRPTTASRRGEGRSSASRRASPTTYQFNPSFGGPLKRDKLWFYFTYKYADNKIYVASSHVRRRQPGVPAGDGQLQRGDAVTWAATQPRQVPLLSREAVQRRVLQRLQHPPEHHARGLDRRVR